MKSLIIIPVLLLIFAACGPYNAASDEGGHEQEHSGEIIQLTLFTDSVEFYVEYPALETNHEGAFLVHLTRLEDYKPLTVGQVKIIADSGDGQSAGISENPVDPGIWRVLLKPEFEGDCKIIFEYTGKSGISRAEFTSAHVGPHHHDDAHEAESSLGDIQFTKEQAWKADFGVGPVKPAAFSSIIKAGGEILAMPSQKYYIHARNTGIVNFSKKELVAGSEVRSDEKLMVIEGQDLPGQNITVEYSQAETKYLKSLSKYERHLKLLRENALSESQFIETRSEYITDSIRFFNLKKSFDGGGLTVSAPIGGHIHELNVSQGEYVEEGQLLATLSSDKRLLLRADVPQQYFSRMKDIISTNFRTSYHKKVWDINDLNGRLLAVGSSVAENNQYLPVYFEAHNNGELLEGAFAEFYLKTRTEENCLLVPIQSILEEQGNYYVYVQVSGESYQKRKIRPGESDGRHYRVLEGIHAGERIVTKGSMLLKAASMSGALPGHSHSH